jgi:hypothetical protein
MMFVIAVYTVDMLPTHIVVKRNQRTVIHNGLISAIAGGIIII